MWPFPMWIFSAMAVPSPGQPAGTAVFCCPDVDTINVFRIEVSDGAADPG